MKKFLKLIIPSWLLLLYKLRNYKKRKRFSLEKRKQFINSQYRKIFDKDIDWNNPITYNEKLNVSKLLYSTKLKTELTDKYLVRNWVNGKKIRNLNLIPLIGAYDKFEDIDFSKLPNKFVMKMNNDSGSVFICNDKNKLSKKELKDLKNKYLFYLKRNYAYFNFEMQYENIKPKIIIEKYMGDSIIDYKFLCFDGKPEVCWLDFDRFSKHTRNFYDLNWNFLNVQQYSYSHYNETIEKPIQFDEMVKIVKKLSSGIDQVRVDLYLIDGKIYFGEMTFTNGSGFEKMTPDEYNIYLGSKWNLRK